MKSIVSFIILVIAFNVNAEKIAFEGKEYKLEIEEESLVCSDFTIKSTTKSLPFSIRETIIGISDSKVSMGHYGRPHVTEQTFEYIKENVMVKLPVIESLLTGYSKIDPKRPYLSHPYKCLGDNKVLFSMWGGGNCSNVCEAFAVIEFTNSGNIKSSKGLTYKEYKMVSK